MELHQRTDYMDKAETCKKNEKKNSGTLQYQKVQCEVLQAYGENTNYWESLFIETVFNKNRITPLCAQGPLENKNGTHVPVKVQLSKINMCNRELL